MAFTHEFKEGDEVEVILAGTVSRRAFYEATVMTSRQVNNKISIKYHHLNCEERKVPLKENGVNTIRPKPPQDLVNNFKLNDNVDVFEIDGWWEGKISEVLDNNGDRFTVLIRGSENDKVVSKGMLRVHREWNDKDGSWNPPPLMLKEVVQEEEQNQLQPPLRAVEKEKKHKLQPPQRAMEKKQKCKLTQLQLPQVVVEEQQQNQLQSQPHHEVGDLVEVAVENKEHVRFWVTAVIVEKIDEIFFLVDYDGYWGVEGTGLSGEKQNVKNIRPSPPNSAKVERFSLGKEVDARYMESCWRSGGVISKVLSDSTRYKVQFRQTGEEEEYDHSELRVHTEWNCRNGSWNPPPL